MKTCIEVGEYRMTDKVAVEKIKSFYENMGVQSILVEKVTTDTLENLLDICNNAKHLEERIEWYKNDNDVNRVSWINVEGEEYGLLSVNKTEEQCRELLKNSVMDYVKRKKEALIQKDETVNKDEFVVIILKNDNETIYHFVERDSSQCDTVYTF